MNDPLPGNDPLEDWVGPEEDEVGRAFLEQMESDPQFAEQVERIVEETSEERKRELSTATVYVLFRQYLNGPSAWFGPYPSAKIKGNTICIPERRGPGLIGSEDFPLAKMVPGGWDVHDGLGDGPRVFAEVHFLGYKPGRLPEQKDREC